jgi:Ca-activated chloride channel family protein
MSRLSRRLIAGVLGAGVLSAGATALAPLGATAASATVGSTAPVMVVLDASGSMNTADAPGPRIAAAKRAVRGLVSGVPASARVGLEVYGTSTGSGGSEKAAGCRDIRVVVPVGPIDRGSFTAQVDAIKASGYTPIGQALRQAAAALPTEGARSIVLVSDGEDTCAPPKPCDVAKELKKQGVDLTVHTVGFKVNSAARAQLQCIAAATGGSYRDAADGPSLEKQLRVQVDKALRGYRTQGVPIDGGATAADAVPMTPGQYVDSFDRGAASVADDGTSKYYLLQLRNGDTPYFSATLIPPARRTAESFQNVVVRIEIRSLTKTYCSVTGSFGYDSSINGKVAASTSVAAPGRIGDTDASCLPSGTAVVKITRAGSAYVNEPLKMEIAYRVEPPADATGLPGPASKQPVPPVQVSNAVTPIVSGTSYNDAPTLRSGSYRDSFVSGESRFVKVHLDWGQRVAYSYTFGKLPGLGILDGVPAYTAIVNPVRQRLTQASGSSNDSSAFVGSTDYTMTDASRVPVRYRNREATETDTKPYSIDGDYYLVLSTGFQSKGDRQLTVPYLLRIQILGAKERGPAYRSEPGGGASTADAGDRSTAGASAAASGSTVTAGAEATANSSSGASTPVVIALVVAAALIVGGAAALMGRRGRRTP